MRLRAVLSGMLVAAALCSASAARADEQSDLEKARAAYLGRRYDEAEERFRALLDPVKGGVKDPLLSKQARMFWAATLVAKKRTEEAVTVLESIIIDDASFEPDPLAFPSEVADLYIDTRKRMTDRINAAKQAAARQEAERRLREEAERKRQAEYLEKLKALAAEEKDTVHHSRWVALVPFGVGQFQNDHNLLGWIFLGTEAALLAGAVAVVPSFIYYRNQAIDENQRDRVKAENYNQRASDLRLVNLAFIGGFVVVAATGVIQAQAAFVPDVVEKKKRPLPQARVAPTIAPEDHGASIGLVGRF